MRNQPLFEPGEKDTVHLTQHGREYLDRIAIVEARSGLPEDPTELEREWNILTALDFVWDNFPRPTCLNAWLRIKIRARSEEIQRLLLEIAERNNA